MPPDLPLHALARHLDGRALGAITEYHKLKDDPRKGEAVYEWDFGETVSEQRRQRLQGYRTFGEVLSLVESGTVQDFAWEQPWNRQLAESSRACFLLQVPEDVYDAFFNSPAGYRGQYARGTHAGEMANRLLISRLETKLLSFSRTENLVSDTLVRASLRASEAKVWVYEAEVEEQLGTEGAEILYGPWAEASSDGVGLRAPVGTRLEIKGGWVDKHGKERRNPFKSSRSEDIHAVGFS